MKLLQAEALGLTLDRFRERLGLAEAPQMQVEEFGTRLSARSKCVIYPSDGTPLDLTS